MTKTTYALYVVLPNGRGANLVASFPRKTEAVKAFNERKHAYIDNSRELCLYRHPDDLMLATTYGRKPA